MKKLLVGLVMAAGIAVMADDYWMYWYIDQDKTGTDYDFAYATLNVAGEGVELDAKTAQSVEPSVVGTSTALGAYADTAYGFYVELFNDQNVFLAQSETVSYSDLLALHAIGNSGIDLQATYAWSPVTMSVPEPSSALLLLLGLGALALRRRKTGPGGSRSARVASVLAVVLFTSGAFAAQNDTLLTFSTPGPDRYADGSVVKDGECYALVWQRDGVEFAGVTAEGLPVDAENSDVILLAPVAKDGRCPLTGFQLSAKRAAEYAGGRYAIYLLDTRLANGRVGGLDAAGRTKCVNGYGEAGKDIGDGANRSAAGAVSVSTVSVPPEGAPRPVIKAIEIHGGNVYLTVANTLGCLRYGVDSVDLGEAPAAAGAESGLVQGDAGRDIILVRPVQGTSGFFRVRRK